VVPRSVSGWLPPHFRLEESCLRAAGIEGWPALATLDDAALRRLAAPGRASEARLRRLRGQARLMVEGGLGGQEAALLLHAGVASVEALAAADPDGLHRQVGRLQRRLTGVVVDPPDLATVRAWILNARRGPGRSRN
jgi:hypothetical protein